MPDEHVTAFVRESEEQITVLNNALLDLEHDPGDEEAMEQIFRTAHSLKGNCGAMGFDRASTLAHAIEDLLEEIRTGRVEPSPEIMDAIFAGVDGLEAMLEEIEREGSPQQEPDDLVESLRSHVTDADGVRPPTDADIDTLLGNSQRPSDDEYNVYHCRLSIAGDKNINGPAVFDALDDAFQLLGTDPPKAAIDSGDFERGFDTLFASVVEKQAVEKALDPVDEVEESIITDVTDRFGPAPEADATEESDEDPISDPTEEPVEDPDDMDVDELLDEVDEFDDLDELAEQVEDTTGLENMGEAGSFADLEIGMDDLEPDEPAEAADEAEPEAEAVGPAATDEPEAEAVGPAATDEPETAADDEPDDAAATFQELKDEVDPVSFDELQDELDELEFDEYDDEEEVGFDELLDEEDLDDSEDDIFETGDTEDEAELFTDEDIEQPDTADTADTADAAASAADAQPSADTPAAESNTEAEAEAEAATADSPAEAGSESESESEPEPATADTPEPATGDSPAEAEAEVEAESEPATADTAEPAAADADSAPVDEAPATAADDAGGADQTAVDDSATADSPSFGDEEDIDIPDDEDLGVGFNEESPADEPGVEVGEAMEDDSFGDIDTSADASGVAGLDEASVEEGFGDDDSSVVDAGTPVDESSPAGSDEATAGPETASSPAVDDDASFGGTPETDDDASFGGTPAVDDSASFTTPDDPGFGDAGEDDEEEHERLELTRLGVPPTGEEEGLQGDDIQSIRVDVNQLDDMLNLVEGLVTSRARLRRALDEGEPRTVLDEEIDDLEDVTSELQDTVMDVRLVPVRTAVTKLPRTVRDIAREQDKEIDFEMVGTDVEVDRSILNAISDPLVHLVRNAVDHGIESPDEREDAGKPAEGSVTLSVQRERERVVIEVEDDGRGIDPDDIRSEAVEEGLVDLETATTMSDDEAFDLVFQSGLSTSEEVSDVSGRGVGMDVVSETVEDLDGEVDIESTAGEGTTVRMELPVTLAIAEVLFVDVGGEEFGIPIRHVEQIGPELGVETEDGREVLVSDGGEDTGTRKELLRLDELLNTPQPAANNGMLVHIQEDVRPVALRCDDVRGQQEVVVKPFEGVLDAVPGLSGATVLGDGDVVNILDIETL
jgi:two-component system chemotaxis sensor kinase CheA